MGNSKANFLIIVLFFSIGAVRANWDYCSNWKKSHKTCNGLQQSPIELNSKRIPLTNRVPRLLFVNYDKIYDLPAKVENNGATVNIQLPKPRDFVESQWKDFDKKSPYITGGDLPRDLFSAAIFALESLHFHWGSKDSYGSEHVMDGKRCSLELHLVHRNTKYSTVEEAMNHIDGLAVVAILYDVRSEFSDASSLYPIVDSLKSIRYSNQSTEIKNFSVGKFPSSLDNDDFLTYPGSLTTPPCSEAVTWQVMVSTLLMSQPQIQAFRDLSNIYGDKLQDNYRSLQAISDRTVKMHRGLLRNIIDSDSSILRNGI